MITAKEVLHFKIFGASIYYHVSKESRKNLEPTTKIGIFVGYRETPHNHRMYLPSLIMTFVRRDVKFDEEKVMQCSLEMSFKSQQKKIFLAPNKEPQVVME